MSTILVIGDVQGTAVWKKIIEKHRGEFDMVVFLGNYFGSSIIPPVNQIKNFYNILNLKKNNLFKAEFLIGHNDFHYLKNSTDMYDYYNSEIHFLLQDELNIQIKMGNLKIAYAYVNMLFSHSGITNTFYYDLTHKKIDIDFYKGFHIDTVLNMTLQNKPHVYNLYANQLYHNEPFSKHADNKYHSPLCVHKNSLIKDVYTGYTQIVCDPLIKNPRFVKYEHTEILFNCPSFNLNYLMIEQANNLTTRKFKVLSL